MPRTHPLRRAERVGPYGVQFYFKVIVYFRKTPPDHMEGFTGGSKTIRMFVGRIRLGCPWWEPVALLDYLYKRVNQ